MSWNYRVVKTRTRRTFKNGHKVESTTYAIREVFYDKKGRPYAYSDEADAPIGDSVDDLRATLVMMLRDTYRMPVLNYRAERRKPIKL